MLKRGLVGLSLWDYGQKDPGDVEYSRRDPDFYRNELDARTFKLRHYLQAFEMQQEAHHQTESGRPWSQIPLYGLKNFKTFLTTNRFWAVHANAQDTDLSDFENEVHRVWSVREVTATIDFAFRVNADAVTLHPGTYDLRSGRFWPKPDEALGITNSRRVIFMRSMVEVIDHFVRRARALEEDIEKFQAKKGWLVTELRGLLHDLELNYSEERVRYQRTFEILKFIEVNDFPIWMVRYCKNPDKGLHLALENVEPPNFLCCTSKQLTHWHQQLTSIYSEACERERLPDRLFDKYRPMIALNPNHLLNSKVILTHPTNRPVSHVIDDFEDLFLPFVNLPCDIPHGNGWLTEPILNQLVRQHHKDILYVQLAGSQMMDNHMTTHDPIKAFRTKMFLHHADSGRPSQRFATSAFDPETELNLEEVVQVLGFDSTFILGVYDCPDELLISSWTHTREFIDYLHREYRTSLDLVRRGLISIQDEAPAPGRSAEEHAKALWEAGRLAGDIGRARFYIRPHKRARDLWRVGFDEAAFYMVDPNWSGSPTSAPVDIFATVKDDPRRVWIKGRGVLTRLAPIATSGPLMDDHDSSY